MIKLPVKGKEFSMRKLAFYSVMMALCMADFAAFGASRTTAAGGRRTTQPAAQQTVSETPAQSSTTTARAAVTRKNVARAAAPVAAAPTNTAPQAARAAVSARAGAKQKVINMGTKVESATANTVVSEECQNAYYGCMDAFCMLDNASGGRCQCSDRNAELDLVLEEIMKLDEQSLAMATEGVERLQMGENAEEIMARAKAAADSVTGKGGGTSSGSVSGSKTVRKLDLSAWKNNSLFDDDDVDFDNTSLFSIAESSLADKTGDALQSEASKLCVAQMPDQCKSSTSFLQLTYAQKIKSDCSAYENSLKQQRSASAEKLQTAQKALRDTALEMYQNENKYDFGQCVAQFKNCMQTTGECGDDYSGCVADTAILGELYNGNKSGHSKPATTVIKTGATSITISSASYDILNTKKVMCQSVTKQCVNANKKDAVWQQVVKDLAPVIYTAEYNAASNNRMNCISTVVTCVQNVCASKWDNDTDNYDACLSDPNSIDNYCGLEYKRCGDADSETNVRNYVSAKLAALKVDKCTKDVKECLLAEERCGADYSGCVGLDTDSIVDLCPDDKLLSCQDRANGGADAVREYIAKIAQGIALNIDNKFATACQNAVDAAFARVCGEDANAEDGECPGLDLSKNEIKGSMSWKYCKGTDCSDSLDSFSNDDIKDHLVKAEIVGRLDDLSNLTFNENGNCGNAKDGDTYFCVEQNNSSSGTLAILKLADGKPTANNNNLSDTMKRIINGMNSDYASTINQIASDMSVKNCMEGKTVQAISTRTRGSTAAGEKLGRQGADARFPQLMSTAKNAISNQLISSLKTEYYKELDSLRDSGKGDEMRQAISQRLQKIIAAELSQKLFKGKGLCDLDSDEFVTLMANEELVNQMKAAQDEENQDKCTSKDDPKYYRDPAFVVRDSSAEYKLKEYKKRPSYDATKNVCTVKIWTYECRRKYLWNNKVCARWYRDDNDDTTKVSYENYQLPEWNSPGSNYFCKEQTK